VIYLENYKRVGETVTLSILRDGWPLTLTVTLGERPTE
jgi:S1-C subfamily serine protease